MGEDEDASGAMALPAAPSRALVALHGEPVLPERPQPTGGALEAHVRGFIVKDAPADSLAAGIRQVAAGHRVIDPDLIAAALETGASPLTGRESDVLRAADEGIATHEIATRLSLSPATVRNYLSNAITKTGARNRIDAIRIARDAGWI
jgi:two-component system response regulator DesR